MSGKDFKSLPPEYNNSDLTIERSFSLSDCTSLTELPANLKVKGDLSLRGCTSLTTLPADLEVQGKIYLSTDSQLIIPEKLQSKIRRN